jgi:hypothetical protein
MIGKAGVVWHGRERLRVLIVGGQASNVLRELRGGIRGVEW